MNRQPIIYALFFTLFVPGGAAGQRPGLVVPKNTTGISNPTKQPPRTSTIPGSTTGISKVDKPPFRPPANLKFPTFQTRGRELIDPCGNQITLKGVNKLSVFEPVADVGATYFPEIANTGANCVRIVWEMNNAQGQPNPLSRLDKLITNAKANRLISIVGLWDFTNAKDAAGIEDGGFSHLNEYVTYWTKPEVVTLINKHQAHLIINIANEAAKDAEHGGNEDSSADQTVYATAYKQAVASMRQAGIRVPLMIDGMDRGKSLKCFKDKGVEMLTADPLHNLIFSFHAYWPKSDTDAQPTYIQDRFNEVRQLPINIVIGELAGFGAGPESTACSSAGAVDYMQFARQATSAQMGWLLWEWGPKLDSQNQPVCALMDMTSDGTYLKAKTSPNQWVRDLIINQPFSLKNSPKTPFVLNAFTSCPTP